MLIGGDPIPKIKFDINTTLFFADGLNEVITTTSDVGRKLTEIQLNIYVPINYKLAQVKDIMEKGMKQFEGYLEI